MSTTISLFDAQGILKTLLHTTDKTRCCICTEKLGTKTYMICKFPEGTDGDTTKEHHGHTACEECAKDRSKYVGPGGSCTACFNALALGRSTRKVVDECVIKAGVALIPAVVNSMANVMLEGFHSAEQRIREVHDQMDTDRIQEGADRRAAAVEDVRRRRAEAEAEAERIKAEAEQMAQKAKERAEADAVRIQTEAKERAEAEAIRMAQEAEADAVRIQTEAKERAEAEAIRMAQEAEADAVRIQTEAKDRAEADERRAKEEAAAEAAQISENAKVRVDYENRERELRLQREDIERAERHRYEDETRAAAGGATAPPVRKRKPQSDDTINRRLEASRRTKEAKKFKIDNYDVVVSERDHLVDKLTRTIEMAKAAIAQMGGDPSEFENDVDASLLRMDGVEEEEEVDVATELGN